MGNNITLQGNLDPTLLYAEEVRRLISLFSKYLRFL